MAVALFATGIWAFFDKQPAYVFTFPNNHADAYFHLATGALFALIAAIQIARDRGLASASRRACWEVHSPSFALTRRRRWCRRRAGRGRRSRRS